MVFTSNVELAVSESIFLRNHISIVISVNGTHPEIHLDILILLPSIFFFAAFDLNCLQVRVSLISPCSVATDNVKCYYRVISKTNEEDT